MCLFRYMSFMRFQELVNEKALTLVDPLKAWEDTYEGPIYQMLKTDKGNEQIRNAIRQYTNDPEQLEQVLYNSIPYIRCQSWSKARDSLVLWNAYSYNKTAIMIESTTKELEKLEIFLKEVRYVADNFLVSEELQEVIEMVAAADGITISNVFGVKREAFAYEQEVRIFRRPAQGTDVDALFKVKIPQIDNFIKNILVHPLAENSFVNEVEEFCKENNIHFGGKSKWYEW